MSAGTLENPTVNTWLPVLTKVGLPTFSLGVVLYVGWTQLVIPLRDGQLEAYRASISACREQTTILSSLNDKCTRLETRTERIEFLLTKDPKVWNFSSQP